MCEQITEQTPRESLRHSRDTPPTVSRWDPVYTDEQRDALARAYEDRRIRPAHRVVSLAEEGTLEPGLAPFKTSPNTVRHYASELRKRRAGEIASDMAKVSHRDAIDALRIQLLSATEHELRRINRSMRNPKRSEQREKHDADMLKTLVRTIREAAAIPEKTAPTPPAPGQTDGQGGNTTGKVGSAGKIAGPLLTAHRQARSPLQDPSPPFTHTDNGTSSDPSPARAHTADWTDAEGLEDVPSHA